MSTGASRDRVSPRHPDGKELDFATDTRQDVYAIYDPGRLGAGEQTWIVSSTALDLEVVR